MVATWSGRCWIDETTLDHYGLVASAAHSLADRRAHDDLWRTNQVCLTLTLTDLTTLSLSSWSMGTTTC
jgi:hypothetical protein